MTTPVTVSPVIVAVRDAIAAAMAGELADVTIVDSMAFAQVTARRSLTVAGTWDPDTGEVANVDAVTVDVTESGAGRRVTETTTIACVAYAGAGDYDLPARRAAVNEMLTAARGALWGLSSVDGAAARAELTTQQWAQIADGQGVGVVASFLVTVTVLP